MTTVTDENFYREVLASSVPVLVHFQAPWCGVCRVTSPILTSFQAELSNQIRLVEINADENLKLANYYQLRTLPTLLYIQNGQVIERIEGFRSRENLRNRLNIIVQRDQLENVFSQSA